MRHKLWMLALLTALASCASLQPSYERPVAPVASTFAFDLASGPAASEIGWSAFFADPQLKQLIELALANNRDLLVAVLNIEQARAQFQVRRADALPTLNAGIAGTRMPQGSSNSNNNNGSITSSSSVSSVYSVGVAVTGYELDLFGRVRSLSDAALATYFGSAEARKAVQISLIANVAATYLAGLSNGEQIELTRQTIATREDSLRLTKLKFDSGVVSELDYQQALSLLEGAKATLAQLQRQRAQDENALTLLIGAPLPAQLPAALRLAGQQLAADLPAGLASELLMRRPDVRQAEQSLIAANANIGSARAAFFPRIALTGSAGSVSSDLGNLFQSGSFAWSFAPSISLPIFDAGRNRANLEAAKVSRDIALAQYERAIQSAFREVADALASRAMLSEQLRAQQAQAAALAQSFKLADLRYRNGAASYLDVLDAQRSLFAAQQAALQVLALQVQNAVSLYKVLGGGWKENSKAQ